MEDILGGFSEELRRRVAMEDIFGGRSENFRRSSGGGRAVEIFGGFSEELRSSFGGGCSMEKIFVEFSKELRMR